MERFYAILIILLLFAAGCSKDREYRPVINSAGIVTEAGNNKVRIKTQSKIDIAVSDRDNDINLVTVSAITGSIIKLNGEFYYIAPETVGTDTITVSVSDMKNNRVSTEIAISILPDVIKKVTFMIYLGGDSTLNDYAAADENEIKAADGASINNVNVVIFADYKNKAPGIFVKKGNQIELIKVLPEWNTGDQSNLTEMINFCHENYKSEKYILSLWGHGDGWHDDPTPGINTSGPARSIAIDDTSDDSLDLWEVEKGISQSQIGKIDIVYTDACLMGMVEIMYQLKDVCDVLAVSPELTPGYGGDYKTIIEELAANAEKDSAVLAKKMQEANLNSYLPGNSQASKLPEIMNVVFSVFDLRTAKANGLYEKFQIMAEKLYSEIEKIKAYQFDYSNILSYNNDDRIYKATNFVDVETLLLEVRKSGISLDSQGSINDFLSAVNESRVYIGYQNGYLNYKEINYKEMSGDVILWETSGLAVFFPFQESSGSMFVKTYKNASRLGMATKWTNIVEAYNNK